MEKPSVGEISNFDSRKYDLVKGKYELLKNKSKEVHLLVKFYMVLISDPVRRIQKSNLARAFVMWKQNLPVLDKCEELGRQLQERTAALNVLRDCYLRDVVAIKYHCERIMNETEARAATSTVHYEDNVSHFVELAAIPSATLKDLLDEARETPNALSRFRELARL